MASNGTTHTASTRAKRRRTDAEEKAAILPLPQYIEDIYYGTIIQNDDDVFSIIYDLNWSRQIKILYVNSHLGSPSPPKREAALILISAG
jgi:hypothetical protein